MYAKRRPGCSTIFGEARAQSAAFTEADIGGGGSVDPVPGRITIFSSARGHKFLLFYSKL